MRFSVTAQQSKGDQAMIDANKKNFTGLPIPAAAAAAVSANLFIFSDEMRNMITLSNETRAVLMVFALTILGYFMVSRWKFPSLKSLHIRVASFKVVFITVIGAVVIFYGLLHYFALYSSYARGPIWVSRGRFPDPFNLRQEV